MDWLKDLDVTKIDDMVQFFRRLLSEKAKNDEEGLKVGLHCTTPVTVEGDPRYTLVYNFSVWRPRIFFWIALL